MKYLLDNYFIKPICELYKVVAEEESMVVSVKNTSKMFSKPVKLIYYPGLQYRLDNCAMCRTYLSFGSKEKIMDFDTLYDYANFIKLIEKMFLFVNDTNNIMVCDSSLTETKKTLVFQLSDSIIVFNLFYDNENKIVDLHIKRNTGKKMENHYRFINASHANEDSLTKSDLTLIQFVADTVCHIMASYYTYVASVIALGKLGEMCLNGIVSFDDPMNPYDNDLRIRSRLDTYSVEQVEAASILYSYSDKGDIFGKLKPNSIIYYKPERGVVNIE